MADLEEELLGVVAREEALHPEQPLSLFPRLVLADWLEEHQGPSGQTRAEFIRLQLACEEAGTPCTLPALAEDAPRGLPDALARAAAGHALACRSQAVRFFKEHARALLEPYPEWVRPHLVFRGGLPWMCHVPWDVWQHHADGMSRGGSGWRLETVRSWRFHSSTDGTQGFEPVAWLPGTPYALEVSGVGAANGFFRSPGVEQWLGTVRELTLAGWAFPKAMTMGMAPTAQRVPALRRLGLPANQIEFEQMLDLGRLGLPPDLEAFSLARNRLTFEDSVFFFEEGWALPHLVELDLSGTGVGLGVLYNLGRSPLCENLRRLNLGHGEIEETLDVEMLLDAAFHGLKDMDLTGNRLSDGFLETLAEAHWLGGLERLNLNEVGSGGQGWGRLIRGLGTTLIELRQGNCGLDPEAVSVLGESPARSSLRHLDLRQNNLGDKGLLELLKMEWPELVLLGIGLNSISIPEPELDRRLTPWLTGVELERP